MSTLNGFLKRNGKVGVINDNTVKQDVNNTHIAIPEDRVQPNQDVTNDRPFTKDQEVEEREQSETKKKPQGKKLKIFEIHRFADKLDIFLMIFGTIFALATGVALPLMMWLFQSVINHLLDLGRGNTTNTTSSNCYQSSLFTGDPYSTIRGIIPWYATIGAVSIVLHWLAYSFWMITSERQLRHMRYAFFESIIRQEIGWFDCPNAGELSSRLVDDLENIREGIGFRVADFICLLSRIIGSIIFSLYVGWKLTLVFLSVSPLIVFSFGLLIRFIVKFTAMESQAYSTANSIAQEVLGAIKTVTAFNGQKKEVERYEKNLTKARYVGIQKGIVLGIIQGVMNVILYGSIAIIFWYGPYLIRTECENYSAGGWIVIFTCCLTSILSFVYLIPNIQSFAETSSSGGYVFEIIDRQSKIDIFNNQGDIPTECRGDIEFRNVHFKYPEREEALIFNDLTIRIPSGKTVALCGSSGCGKSTLIKLIERFYDPYQGEILLDGNDLCKINLKWLRSNIGIVSQEPVLFFGTIEDNIRFGKPNATKEEIENAAKIANAHDFIMRLPQNYETLAADQLSGGQKQRVAIARALISNPKILLLDEATSALDNQNEKLVQDALNKAKEGRTTIVVAHRLSTIRNADIIFGLDHGQIIEYGTHDELMAKKGLYYGLINAQSGKEIQVDSNEEDENKEEEEELVRQISQTTKNITRQMSRPMSFMRRRSSNFSDKTTTSVGTSGTGNDLPTIDEIENSSRFRLPILLKIVQLNIPEWYYLLLGGIASVAFGAVMPSFSLIFSYIFGVLTETDLDKQTDEIRTYTYAIFLIGVGGAICQMISSFTLTKAGEELTMRMRIMSFQSILRQEIGWFDIDENNLGALVTRLSSDAAALRGFTGPIFGAILNTIGALIAALIISFQVGWKLTLVVLCFTPLMILNGMLQNQHFSKPGKNKAATSDAEEGGKYATQAIENIRTVVSLHLEEHFLQKYKQAFDKDFRNRMKSVHYVSAANAFANSVMYFIHAATFGYGVTLVKSGEMQFQNVFRVFSVITYTAITVGRSVSMLPNYSRGKASAARILHLNQRQSIIDPENSSGITLPSIKGDIQFRDVRFRYPARTKLRILRNFNFTCNSGQTTALVGPSGSGKSTTIALIERFYDPITGSILLDGHNIKTFDIQWLRSLFGLVQQEPILFNLSISDNIAYGDNTKQVTQDQIEAAARKANIHHDITSLPDGYQTLCGAKGNQLAGGQKQRIAIARALIRDPKILLFDEATSAQDNQSEKIIQEALDQARIDRTCLTIAQRLSTIRNSDQISVLDAGQIQETGRHEQLIQQHGMYYKLNIAQESPHNTQDI